MWFLKAAALVEQRRNIGVVMRVITQPIHAQCVAHSGVETVG